MKYIRDFNSLEKAKRAILYSPTITQVSDESTQKLLFADTHVADEKLRIKPLMDMEHLDNDSIEIRPETVTFNVVAGPNVTSVTGSGTYATGTQVTLTAVIPTGYKLLRWYFTMGRVPIEISTSNPCTIYADFDMTIYAEAGVYINFGDDER